MSDILQTCAEADEHVVFDEHDVHESAEERARLDEHGILKLTQASVAAELAASVVERARRAQ